MLLPSYAQSTVLTTRPEAELLLCCARTCIDAEKAEQISALLQKDINWPYLVTIAYRNKLIPLLCQSLYKTFPESVPSAVLEQFRDYFYVNASRNFLLAREMLKLLQLFEACGIRSIPFKGPMLAATAYGDFALRQFGDLDFLVHPRDFHEAKKLLLSQGYHSILKLKYEHHFARDKVIVDLQKGITAESIPFRFDFDDLWTRRELVLVADTVVPNLSPEDTLITLCIKIAEDWSCRAYRDRLLQICDLAELLYTHPEINWEQTMREAKSLGSQRILLLGLCLARDLLGVVLPVDVLYRIRADSSVNSLVARIREQPFYEDSVASALLPTLCFHIRMRERLQDKILSLAGSLAGSSRQFLRNVFMPTDKERVFLLLPPSLFFLYYFLRPIRLMAKYGRILLRRLLATSRPSLLWFTHLFVWPLLFQMS